MLEVSKVAIAGDARYLLVIAGVAIDLGGGTRISGAFVPLHDVIGTVEGAHLVAAAYREAFDAEDDLAVA
ncbi:hypothetical protein IMCC1989_2652 [gamma proteobacterium IMCC1989]|nr:hypothetical protein IMCC1989_2652 [gamma proteobacterium IMCC1989]